MYTIEALVAAAWERKSSDIHIVKGLTPKCRIDGELVDLGTEPRTTGDCVNLSKWLAGDAYDELLSVGELDLSGDYAGCRCRVHIFRQQGIPSIALRLLRDSIPALSQLGLPPTVEDFAKLHKGIVLVTGETGSGKSTTLASLLDTINHNRRGHIVTLEDPIEYIHKPDLCVINQREVGRDTQSFASGLRASLREDPDVILIGEMRDRETIETAITAAETGHLVFATLHTSGAADAIDRIVQCFPEGMQIQIRLQLSMTLQAVLTQQLLKKKGGGRVLACELMIVTDAIRNLIRSGNTPQIYSAISTSAQSGGMTMDQSLVRLQGSGQIARETAIEYARDPVYVKKYCR